MWNKAEERDVVAGEDRALSVGIELIPQLQTECPIRLKKRWSLRPSYEWALSLFQVQEMS